MPNHHTSMPLALLLLLKQHKHVHYLSGCFNGIFVSRRRKITVRIVKTAKLIIWDGQSWLGQNVLDRANELLLVSVVRLQCTQNGRLVTLPFALTTQTHASTFRIHHLLVIIHHFKIIYCWLYANEYHTQLSEPFVHKAFISCAFWFSALHTWNSQERSNHGYRHPVPPCIQLTVSLEVRLLLLFLFLNFNPHKNKGGKKIKKSIINIIFIFQGPLALSCRLKIKQIWLDILLLLLLLVL